MKPTCIEDSIQEVKEKNQIHDELDNNYVSEGNLQTDEVLPPLPVLSADFTRSTTPFIENNTDEGCILHQVEVVQDKRQGTMRKFFNRINIFRRKSHSYQEGFDAWGNETQPERIISGEESEYTPGFVLQENTESESEPYFDPLQYPLYNKGKMNHKNMDLCQCKYCCSINYPDPYDQLRKQAATATARKSIKFEDQIIKNVEMPMQLERSEMNENAYNNNPSSVIQNNNNNNNGEEGEELEERYMNFYNGLDNFIQEWGEADRDFRCQTFLLNCLFCPFLWTYLKLKIIWSYFKCRKVKVGHEVVRIRDDDDDVIVKELRDTSELSVLWVGKKYNVPRRASCSF